MVVAEGDEFHAAQREDVHIRGRGAEGEVLVRRHVVVREHALEVRHREVVVLKILYGLFKDVAEVVCRDHVLVGDGGVPVIRHGVWGDVPDEADVEDLGLRRRRGLGALGGRGALVRLVPGGHGGRPRRPVRLGCGGRLAEVQAPAHEHEEGAQQHRQQGFKQFIYITRPLS